VYRVRLSGARFLNGIDVACGLVVAAVALHAVASAKADDCGLLLKSSAQSGPKLVQSLLAVANGRAAGEEFRSFEL
jgi:hypothetical protein